MEEKFSKVGTPSRYGSDGNTQQEADAVMCHLYPVLLVKKAEIILMETK